MNNNLLEKLYDIQNQLGHIGGNDLDVLILIKDKTRLYLQRFFKNNTEYLERLEKIDVDPDPNEFNISFNKSKNQLKSLVSTLIEELEMEDMAQDPNKFELKEAIKKIEEDKERLEELRKSIELKNTQIKEENRQNQRERAQLINQNEEFKKLQDDLKKERERLLETSNILDEVNKKLEITDKTVDFQNIAKSNKNTAYLEIVN